MNLRPPAPDADVYVPIAPLARLVICFVVLFYFIIAPIVRELNSPDVIGSEWVMAAESLATLLAFAPLFVLVRRRHGWFHPLLLIPLLALVKLVLLTPEAVLFPFAQAGPGGHDPLVRGFSENQVTAARIKAALLQSTALLSAYAGYFLGRKKAPISSSPAAPESTWPLVLVILALLAAGVAFLAAQGGFARFLASLSVSRFSTLREVGPTVALISAAPMLCTMWFALDSRALRRPLFWALYGLALALSFATTGSRSTIIYSLMSILILYSMKRRRLPIAAIAVAGVVSVMLLFWLGQVRQSGWGNEQIDMNLFTVEGFAEALPRGRESLAERRMSSPLVAIAASVPDPVPHLYGVTYLPIVFIWLPRFIWPDKPRAAGVLLVHVFLSGGSVDDSWSSMSYGIPVGSVGEAYWNFGLAGVILVHLLYGALLRFLGRSVERSSRGGFMLFTYVLVMIHFDVTTIAVVSFLHQFVFALIVYILLVRLAGRGAPAQQAVPDAAAGR